MYIFSILFISLQKLVNKPTKRMKKEAKSAAIMFKVSQRIKDDLRKEAKRQTELRGHKVTMTALLCEWVATLRQTA